MLPARGATFYAYRKRINSTFQSTLPARGATLAITMRTFRACYFNPRSPHGERLHSPHVCRAAIRFQSTLPARGATLPTGWTVRGQRYFNPRSPHGERPQSRANPQRCWKFQSTLPARGATLLTRQSAGASVISIHAPRTGSDLPPSSAWNPNNLFQSTLPARGATTSRMRKNCYFLFQSTLPARGATDSGIRADGVGGNFNPRSPHGERRTLKNAKTG